MHFPYSYSLQKSWDKEENRWLCSLRNDITDRMEIENLVRQYEEKKNSKLYQAAMEVITRANWKAMKEVKSSMCEALKELMAEEFQEVRDQDNRRSDRTTHCNAYKNIGDLEKVSEILGVPVETVKKAVEKEK